MRSLRSRLCSARGFPEVLHQVVGAAFSLVDCNRRPSPCPSCDFMYIGTVEHDLRPRREVTLDSGNHQVRDAGPLLSCQNP